MSGTPVSVPSSNSNQVPAFLESRRERKFAKRTFKLTRERSNNAPAKKSPPPPASCVTVDNSISKLDVVRQAVSQLGWKEFRSRPKAGPCDIYWQLYHYHHPPTHEQCRVNKFPRMSEILHKINMTRNLMNMQRLYSEEYDFFPQTWFLPEETHEFTAQAAYERRKEKDKKKSRKTYIVKPDNGTHGDGIFLIKDPGDLAMLVSGKRYVVQEYISNPLLVDRTKFDLRVYVVVSSLDPLKVYLSREGLARFCTVRYQPPTNRNLQESFMHLTNYSLNKSSKTYVHTNRMDSGSKQTLTSVFHKLSAKGYDTSTIWQKIEKVVIKTILAILPELKIAKAQTIHPPLKTECFQILGFDILLTDEPDLEAILLEVNACPSLGLTYEEEKTPGMLEVMPSAVDEYVKVNLVKETLQLVCPKYPRSKVGPRKPKKPPANRRYIRRPTTQRSFIRTEEEAAESSDCSSNDNSSDEGDPSLSDKEDQMVRDLPDFSIADPDRFLYEVFPGAYEMDYKSMNITDRLAFLYHKSLGVRRTSTMSANHFRMFARRSKLDTLSSNLTVAALDILFIELQQKWENSGSQASELGMCFLGFIDAFFIMSARSRMYNNNLLETVEKVLGFCESNILQSASKRYLPVLSLEQKQQMRLKTLFNHACDIDRQLADLRASMKRPNSQGRGQESRSLTDGRKPPFNLYQHHSSSKWVSFDQFKRSLNIRPNY